MAFSTDYSEVKDFELVPVGEYEVIIMKIEERVTPNGKTGLNIKMIIRNDVEQGSKNRYLFHTFWKRREPTKADIQVQGYGFNQIMQLAKAAKLPSGKSYENVNALCADLIGHPMRVTINHEEFNGKQRENVRYMNPTNFPDVKHVSKEKPVVTADTVAQKPQEQFAGVGNLDDFEEILGDEEVPF